MPLTQREVSADIGRLMTVAEQPYALTFEELRRTTGKKLVGIVPMHVPEELVGAAGLAPVLIMHTSESVTTGKQYVPEYFCSPVRELTASAASGQLTALGGVIVPNTCHETRGLTDVMKRHSGIGWVRGLYLPPISHSRHIKPYLIECLQELRNSLAELSGHEVTDEALHASISLYNKNKSLIQRLYGLRRSNPGIMSPRQMAAIVLSGTLMPKDAHNEILERIVSELENAPTSHKETGVRLVLSGCFCEPMRGELLDIVEEVGGTIVDDDLFMGSRYYATLVREEGDPVDALADAYMNRVAPCPTRYDPDNDWGEYLVNMVRASGAEGIISVVVQFCEPHLYYHRLMLNGLRAVGIPELTIETGINTQLAQIRTRFQAFVEMLAVKRH